MSWISVHKGVDGPKLRKLYKALKCSKFEAIGILNFLWFWGQENAQKDGMILYADREDIEQYILGAGVGCKIPASDIVFALFDAGWLDEHDGHIYLHDWDQWQAQWYAAMERREKDVARKRESRNKSKAAAGGEPPTADNEETVPEPPDLHEEPVGEGKKEEKPKYVPSFEQFWTAYPRKIGKADAYKKYQARLKDGYSEEDLLTAATQYAKACIRMKTETQYIKHPKTFLSDTMPFVDYLPKKQTTTAPAGSNPFAQVGDPR